MRQRFKQIALSAALAGTLTGCSAMLETTMYGARSRMKEISRIEDPFKRVRLLLDESVGMDRDGACSEACFHRRRESARMLERVDGKEPILALIDGMGDQDPEVREISIKALCKIAGERSDEPGIRMMLPEMLYALKDVRKDHLPETADAVHGMGKAIFPALERLIQDPRSERRVAGAWWLAETYLITSFSEDAIGLMGKAIPTLLDAQHSVIEGVRKDSSQTLLMAIEMLKGHDPEPLIRSLKAPDAKVRRKALTYLVGVWIRSENPEILKDIFSSSIRMLVDDDASVREKAVLGVGLGAYVLRDSQSVSDTIPLLHHMSGDPDMGVARLAREGQDHIAKHLLFKVPLTINVTPLEEVFKRYGVEPHLIRAP